MRLNNLNYRSILAKYETELHELLDCQAQWGAEIEFYILDTQEDLDHINKKISVKTHTDYIIKKEEGNGQYELDISPNRSAIALADDIILLRDTIYKTFNANFTALPIATEPGNSMQINVSLYDKNLAKNIFTNQTLLEKAIAGLCAKMPEHMIYFAPTAECYKRLSSKLYAPNKVSWGGNNRSTAIRIPVSDEYNRRIEHRVPSSIACPYQVISAILYGILHGIQHNLTPPTRIYGNAWDAQYDLPMLPDTLEKAQIIGNKLD